MEQYVYIITNKNNTVLYIGQTNDIVRRLYEHRNGFVNSFSKKYGLYKLLYLEKYSDAYTAINREKQLKRWTRAKKLALIEKDNPYYKDLGEEYGIVDVDE